jgi:hypothetical protein
MSDTAPTIIVPAAPAIAIAPAFGIRELIDRFIGETLQLSGNPTATAANTPRNPKFESAAKLYLKGKKCMICGGTLRLMAHHKYPFHLFPELEMDETHWRPLCEGDHRLNCHLLVGHGGNFEGFNPLVDEFAGLIQFLLRTNSVLLSAIRQEIKANVGPQPAVTTATAT